MYILGAGLSGCIAAIMIPDSKIIEAGETPTQHRAVLRFKTDVVSQATGIPFREVDILKSIWLNGEEVQPSPRVNALYSHKVTGTYATRSIASIARERRFIAPIDFHQQMLDKIKYRIIYNHKVYSITRSAIGFDDDKSFQRDGEPVISTIPIHVLAGMMKEKIIIPKANYKRIFVTTLTVPNCDLFSTVYFPGEETAVYRASLTGHKLIIESVAELDEINEEIYESLGIDKTFSHDDDWNFEQKIGKITLMDDDQRKNFLYQVTAQLGVYSLGRFATWRNIELTDVVGDVGRIKQMMTKKSSYDATLEGLT